MAEVTKKALVLTFTCENGDERSLTINTPAEALEPSVISKAMDELVTAKTLLNTDGTSVVSAKKEAKYVIQEEDKVTL